MRDCKEKPLIVQFHPRPTMCCIYQNSEEFLGHILLHCPFGSKGWSINFKEFGVAYCLPRRVNDWLEEVLNCWCFKGKREDRFGCVLLELFCGSGTLGEKGTKGPLKISFRLLNEMYVHQSALNGAQFTQNSFVITTLPSLTTRRPSITSSLGRSFLCSLALGCSFVFVWMWCSL